MNNILEKEYIEYLNKVLIRKDDIEPLYQVVCDFDNKDCGCYNIADHNGNYLFPYWLEYATDYNAYCFCIRVNGKYNFVDSKGKIINEEWLDYVRLDMFSRTCVFNEVKINGEKRYINLYGKLLPDIFEYIRLYDNGFGIGHLKDDMYAILNDNGDVLYKYNYLYQPTADESRMIVKKDRLTKTLKRGEYSSFLMSNDIKYIDSYSKSQLRIPYIPIHDFGNTLLCHIDSNLYLLNKKNMTNELVDDKYTSLLDVDYKIENNYFRYNDKAYYVEDNIVDIGVLNKKYYSYAARNNVWIKREGVASILTYNEFESEYRKNPDLNKMIEVRREEQVAKAKYEQNKKELEQYDVEIKNLMHQISEVALLRNKLVQYGNSKKGFIDEDILFIDVDGHKEINPVFTEFKLLNFINLAGISFDNVKVSNMDFSGTNADINPQTVYKRDMSNGNYSGLFFGSYSFNGVNVTNSVFNCDFICLDGAINNSKSLNLIK